MTNVDECWIRLAEAIITEGMHEYVRASTSLMKEKSVTLRRNYPRITDYITGKKFVLCGCNGLVGGDPETLLKDVNYKYGIDGDKIDELIRDVRMEGE